MSSKIFFISLLLFLSILNSSLSRKTSDILQIKNYTNIKILHANGFLYEFKPNQKLHFIVQGTINSSEIRNITLILKETPKYTVQK